MSKVIYARLQTTAWVPGLGDLGVVFPPQGGKTLRELVMQTTEEGLSISFKHNNTSKSILVPFPNVVLMEVVAEEETAAKPKAKAS